MKLKWGIKICKIINYLWWCLLTIMNWIYKVTKCLFLWHQRLLIIHTHIYTYIGNKELLKACKSKLGWLYGIMVVRASWRSIVRTTTRLDARIFLLSFKLSGSWGFTQIGSRSVVCDEGCKADRKVDRGTINATKISDNFDLKAY